MKKPTVREVRDAIASMVGAKIDDTADLPDSASCYTCKHSRNDVAEPPCNLCRWGYGLNEAEILWEESATN